MGGLRRRRADKCSHVTKGKSVPISEASRLEEFRALEVGTLDPAGLGRESDLRRAWRGGEGRAGLARLGLPG